jgi:ABC-type branched-subunit amino acid transport system substrate-binding protein
MRITVTQTVIQTLITPPQTPIPQTTPAPTPPSQLPDKILIGMAVPLSGSQADAGKRGFWGVLAAIR